MEGTATVAEAAAETVGVAAAGQSHKLCIRIAMNLPRLGPVSGSCTCSHSSTQLCSPPRSTELGTGTRSSERNGPGLASMRPAPLLG